MNRRLAIELRGAGVRRGTRWALKDVSLKLEPGERWALVGGNGSGKTQLLKLLATLVWPTPAARTGQTGESPRSYRVGARTVDIIEAKDRTVYVGAELQDKYARYGWNLPVTDVLLTGLKRTDLLHSAATARERGRVRDMLERCGLAELRGRRFLTLSYGQKRLVLLARALIQRPDWLLLDEFYNGLDREFRGRLDRMLAEARRGGQGWVVAAHRVEDVPRGTGRLIALDDGRAVSVGRLVRREFERGMAGRLPARLAPLRRPGRKVRAMARRGRVLIRLVGADLYVDYRPVLCGVDWEWRTGEHWVVMGANGAGKSSFLKLLYGDLSPALGGTIERSGIPRGTPIDAWKRRVGYISPELQTDYQVEVSLLELVASGRHASIGLSDAPTTADLARARRWLGFFGLRACAASRPRELSYGQLRRALFARAMAAEPRCLLLDEPLTGLDPRQRESMKRLLERLMQRSVSLVIAVHHADDLPRGMTHALRLRGQAAHAEAY